MRKALCLLTKIPNEIWLKFLDNFKEYDIFIIIDDNEIDYNEKYKNVYKNMKLIQIDNRICYSYGYTNCNSAVGFPDVISWDKSLYLLNEIETKYEYVWLIEDDVFFRDENVLLKIDEMYNETDLLTSFHHITHSNDNLNDWWNHWVNIIDRIELPWAHSMVCACRLSRKLLTEVVKYKNKKGHLFFIEAMFNTIVLQNNLTIENPTSLSTIHWRTSWNLNDINYDNLYHPIKNIDDHDKLRSIYECK